MLRQIKLNKKPIPQRWKWVSWSLWITDVTVDFLNRKELQYMLHSRHKAEIEILCVEKKQ